jgi:hypothetical protein
MPVNTKTDQKHPRYDKSIVETLSKSGSMTETLYGDFANGRQTEHLCPWVLGSSN